MAAQVEEAAGGRPPGEPAEGLIFADREQDTGLPELKFIDLFCGGGGLALGFREAGFNSVWALDMDEASCETYRANFRHNVLCGEIESVKKSPTKADVVVGGPPCQGFSPLGSFYKSADHRHEAMNRLWEDY